MKDNIMKKLFKSEKNKVICGVCGGLGEYFNIDPVVIRIIWAILICCAGTGFFAYILAAIIIPRESVPVTVRYDEPYGNNYDNGYKNG